MLPGGGIDAGEFPWQAAQREFKEEYGKQLPDLRKENNSFASFNYHNHTQIYIGCTRKQLASFDITTTKKPYEVSEAKWVCYDDVFSYDLKDSCANSLKKMIDTGTIQKVMYP
jgi:8-oxo-dGTP pyrophosphatase MutT (NUDIX family)